MKTIIFAFMVIAQAYASNAVAKLRTVPFDEMVKKSDLIVIASPDSIFKYRNGSGYADLKVERVIKGQFDKGLLHLKWSSEHHDSKVRGFSTMILFLRQKGSEYVSTTYGRGVLPIDMALWWDETEDDVVEHSIDYIEYRYPVTDLKFDEGVVKNIKEEERRREKIGDCKQDEKVKGIYLDELIAIILNNEK